VNEAKPKARVPSVVRTLSILEALATAGELGLADLAARIGLNKSTVFRFMRTLCRDGYASRDPDTERFALTLKVFELGSAVHARLDLTRLAGPLLVRLSATTRETVHLAVMEGARLVYLHKIESPQSLRVAMESGIGLSAPAYCTGVGKVLLAFSETPALEVYLASCNLIRYTERTIAARPALLRELEAIRARGWAVDDEEHEYGVRCVAAPVRDRRGSVVAALSISGPSIRFTPERIETVRTLVCEVADEISGLLGLVPGAQGSAGVRGREAGARPGPLTSPEGRAGDRNGPAFPLDSDPSAERKIKSQK